MSECTICGYEWLAGRDGSHSCTEYLNKVNKQLIKHLQGSIDYIDQLENSINRAGDTVADLIWDDMPVVEFNFSEAVRLL